jgi:nucleoside-diphosphate-sugar epimerase
VSKTFAVTGASGWLGKAAASVLEARGHPVFRFASRARGEIRHIDELPRTPHDVLLHFSFVTRDHVADSTTDAYISANRIITDLTLIAIKRFAPAVFYASSGVASNPGPLAEDPYGALKARDEDVFRQATGGCAIARIYNVGGPHVTKPNVFLLTDIIRQALATDTVVLTSHRPVLRSFVDVEDVAEWAIAMAGQDVRVDAAGPQIVESQALVRLVESALERQLTVSRPGYDAKADPDSYFGDANAWLQSCGSAGVRPRTLEEIVARTVADLATASEPEARPNTPGFRGPGWNIGRQAQ